MRKLFLVLFLTFLPGCGAAGEIGAGVAIGVDVAKFSCEGAQKLCDWTGNAQSGACLAIEHVCTDVGALAPVVEGVARELDPAGIDAQ